MGLPVILASASPRRQELLRQLIEEFRVIPAEVDEDALTVADPWQTAMKLAKEKAFAVFDQHPESLVIAGDTVVALPDPPLRPLPKKGQHRSPDLSGHADQWTQLSKPTDARDAKRMLRALAGQSHVVITGVCVRGPEQMTAFTESAIVTFRELSEEEIDRYVATGSPLDKAGAYGLQDESQDFITGVEGDVETVIGLPVAALREALKS